MTVSFRPIKPEEFQPKCRTKSNAAEIVDGFIASGKSHARVEQNGKPINKDTSTREERKRLHTSLAGYCERHGKPVKVVTGMDSGLLLQRVQP